MIRSDEGDRASVVDVANEGDGRDSKAEADGAEQVSGGREVDGMCGSCAVDSDGEGDRGTTAVTLLPCVAADGLLELFRRWIYRRHEEVQDYTSGFVVTVDYVGYRNAQGQIPCYGDFLAAQRAAVQVMNQDALVIAIPCDVERYKRALDEQLRWIEAILADVLVGDHRDVATGPSRRRKRRAR